MSEDSSADTSCCASCGIAEVDDIKLKECDDCDLVRYCSVDCEEDGKSQHEEACKKRAAELREEILFKQPESSHLGDCPICCLPVPLDVTKSIITTCCSKIICIGCDHANKMREIEGKLSFKCPFCRRPVPREKRFRDKQMLKRVEANDPVAMRYEGIEQYRKGDYRSAFGYLMKAAELGDVEAHFKLSLLYHHGEGVEKDEGMETYHLEEAAIGGHPFARHNLGCHEWNNDNNERAVKHWIIAAKLGDDDSIKALMDAFKIGLISKEEFAATLRANQAAVDATKSPQREAAEEFYRNLV
jgi:hypothetical protein